MTRQHSTKCLCLGLDSTLKYLHFFFKKIMSTTRFHKLLSLKLLILDLNKRLSVLIVKFLEGNFILKLILMNFNHLFILHDFS